MAQILEFASRDLIEKLDILSPAILDSLPFGIIKVDDRGDILFYSAFESQLVQVDVHRALGKNFFQDIAPCTADPTFEGRFKEGVRNGNLDVYFRYDFDGAHIPDRQSIQVIVHMTKATIGPYYYIMVKRL